jgi:uncharacterized membrane protein
MPRSTEVVRLKGLRLSKGESDKVRYSTISVKVKHEYEKNSFEGLITERLNRTLRQSCDDTNDDNKIK